jgi:hypothetical protein
VKAKDAECETKLLERARNDNDKIWTEDWKDSLNLSCMSPLGTPFIKAKLSLPWRSTIPRHSKQVSGELQAPVVLPGYAGPCCDGRIATNLHVRTTATVCSRSPCYSLAVAFKTTRGPRLEIHFYSKCTHCQKFTRNHSVRTCYSFCHIQIC